MSPEERQELERAVRAACGRGDVTEATTLAIRGYGPELHGFLCALTRGGSEADELFAATCEKLWRHLAGFRWESSLRVWAYAIARNEFLAARRAGSRRPLVALSEAPRVLAAVEAVRTTTPPWQRTEVKDEFARLREELEPDDQMLLGLRLDRGLEWSEVARVLGAEPPALRKRFERLKKRLRARARERGLIG